jgi:hypothetical protein
MKNKKLTEKDLIANAISIVFADTSISSVSLYRTNNGTWWVFGPGTSFDSPEFDTPLEAYRWLLERREKQDETT